MVDATVVAVIGMGYVGLPLSRAACKAGMRVIGVDIDPILIDRLARGSSHVADVDDDDIDWMLKSGFEPVCDFKRLPEADVIVITVPTPLRKDRSPDISAIVSATKKIGRHLRQGQLVVLESTTFPGTTDEVVLPILESSGLAVGVDFFLGYSPERIDPGNATFAVESTPRVISGLTTACLGAMKSFYSKFVRDLIVARGVKEAEMSKLIENTYRHVNIALVNELATASHSLGIDIWDALRCARSKPFGYSAFSPGPGVGGHCIPVDPYYLSHHVRSKLAAPLRIVELAQEINLAMPEYVVSRSKHLLNTYHLPLEGRRISLVGVAYKAGASDLRESPGLRVGEILLSLGVSLSYFDPYVHQLRIGNQTIQRFETFREALENSDLVIVLQDLQGIQSELSADNQTLILDTRGTLAGPWVQTM